jgi:TatD DNase family protein
MRRKFRVLLLTISDFHIATGPRYIDSHAHLFDDEFKEDLAAVLDRAHQAGVDVIVVPATDLESSRTAVGLAEEHAELFACVGIHPHEALKATEADLLEIEGLSSHPKVVGIGEIGLDYHYQFCPPERQKEIFERQIEIASRKSLPVVVHMRESAPDSFSIIEEAVRKYPAWLPDAPAPRRGVFHCFPGTAADATRLRANGFWVSFTGIVTFRKSPAVETIQRLGFQNILLETDSPYLTPVPLRGKRNEPANVALVGRKVAEISGVDEDVVATATTENAKRLFRLER